MKTYMHFSAVLLLFITFSFNSCIVHRSRYAERRQYRRDFKRQHGHRPHNSDYYNRNQYEPQ